MTWISQYLPYLFFASILIPIIVTIIIKLKKLNPVLEDLLNDIDGRIRIGFNLLPVFLYKSGNYRVKISYYVTGFPIGGIFVPISSEGATIFSIKNTQRVKCKFIVESKKFLRIFKSFILREVKVEDLQFDSEIIIKSNDEEFIKRLIRYEKVKETLIQLSKDYGASIKFTGKKLILIFPYYIYSADLYSEVIALSSELMGKINQIVFV